MWHRQIFLLLVFAGLVPSAARGQIVEVDEGESIKISGGRPASDEILPDLVAAAKIIVTRTNNFRRSYRSPEPVLTPELPQERWGTVSNVVFPTGIDRRDDLGLPDHFDVYYGMADSRIGVARLGIPEHLPAIGAADPPEARVQSGRARSFTTIKDTHYESRYGEAYGC